MIYLDSRTGSGELFTMLQARRLPVEMTTLRFGDLAFAGHGPRGETMIGIERKKTKDLIQSLTSGRLSGHQLPGLVEDYAYRWLVVEGNYRESPEGLIEVPRGGSKPWELVRFKYIALENYLITLALKGGLHVQRTYSADETVAWTEALYRWWTAKEWKDHRSHLALHQSSDYAVFFPPSLAHRMAAQLPGIDEVRAPLVARHFGTPLTMALAEIREWQQISGIGPTISSRVYKAIRSRE